MIPFPVLCSSLILQKLGGRNLKSIFINTAKKCGERGEDGKSYGFACRKRGGWQSLRFCVQKEGRMAKSTVLQPVLTTDIICWSHGYGRVLKLDFLRDMALIYVHSFSELKSTYPELLVEGTNKRISWTKISFWT